MPNKTILALAIAAAFVVGTITTGTTAYATLSQCDNVPPKGQANGQPWLEVWAAICELQDKIDNIDVNDADSDPTNEIQTLTTRAISAGHAEIPAGETRQTTLECISNEVLTGYDTVFRGTAEAGTIIPITSGGSVTGMDLEIINPPSGEPDGEGVLRIICSSLESTP